MVKQPGFLLDQHAVTKMLMNFVNVVVILSEFLEVNFWRIFLCQWPSAYVLSSLTKSHLYPTSEIMTKNRSKVRGGVVHIALHSKLTLTFPFSVKVFIIDVNEGNMPIVISKFCFREEKKK